MLKLGTIKFRGKCSRHPNFQPHEGEGAVRGGCKRCLLLVEIHEAHRRLARLIADYGAQYNPRPQPHPDDGRQMPLFGTSEPATVHR